MEQITYSGTVINPPEDRIYYMDANQSGGLEKAFAGIAEANTGDTGAELVSVDALTDSFDLPEDIGTAGRIKLYTAQCIGTKEIDGGNYLAFAQPVPVDSRPPLEEIWLNGTDEDGHATWTRHTGLDIDDDIAVDIIGKKLVFKGFDLAGLWCGKDGDTDHHNTQQVAPGDPNARFQDPLYRGFKLIAEIPIVVSSTAVGGPGVGTNVSELSGVFATDGSGQPEGNAIEKYPQPSLSIPVRLTIRKTGLAQGESASFTIERKPADGSGPYTEFTRFVLTGGSSTPEIRFVSLDSRYHYRVKETGWSWAYDLTAPSTIPSTEDPALQNPIIFTNKPKSDTPKRAEAKAVNRMRAEVSETTTVYDVN